MIAYGYYSHFEGRWVPLIIITKAAPLHHHPCSMLLARARLRAATLTRVAHPLSSVAAGPGPPSRLTHYTAQ